ncbi:MAG: hypothetical protein ACFCUQ_01780 [Kiloniellales bacterium]
MLLAVLVLGASSHAVQAQQSVPIDAFVGVWRGSGIASGESGYVLDETVRDLDVTIRKAGEGFTIDWVTVLRKGPEGSREAERKESSITLQPAARPGLYRPAEAGDLFGEEGLTWARLDRQTLSLYRLVLGERGALDLSRYDRTLLGGGMKLEFTRQQDGKLIRSVTGRLVKAAN